MVITVMVETKIEWCDYTWNPWRGCSEVSPGCANCYAREFSKRNPKVLGTWGADGTRPLATEKYLMEPIEWNLQAMTVKGAKKKVFCGSLMDFFEDRQDLEEYRRIALNIILRCPNLWWLILTKRSASMLDIAFHGNLRFPRSNIIYGVTIEDQARADLRMPHVRHAKKSHMALTFLSVEPLLGPVDFSKHFESCTPDWVIVGGESGAKARACELSWVEEIVNQCRAFKVPVFVKQMGARCVADGQLLRLMDRKGGDESEWPEWLRVREFPECLT